MIFEEFKIHSLSLFRISLALLLLSLKIKSQTVFYELLVNMQKEPGHLSMTEKNEKKNSILFLSKVPFSLSPVHTTPKKIENAALLLGLGIPSTQNDQSRKRSFSKTLFKPQEIENAGLAFS